jgi:ribonuclease Z
MGRTAALHIFGPDQIEEFLLNHLKFFQNDLSFEIVIHKFQNRRSSLIYQDNKIEVRTIPLQHRIPTCGFLFREKEVPRNIKKDLVDELKISIRDIVKIKNGEDYLTADGKIIPNSELTLPPYRTRSYAYCSDTAYSENIIEMVRSVNLLYFETTFLHKDKDLAIETLHSTTKQAADIALKANVGKLIIGHFSSRYRNYDAFETEAQAIFPDTRAVMDGDVFFVNRIREK